MLAVASSWEWTRTAYNVLIQAKILKNIEIDGLDAVGRKLTSTNQLLWWYAVSSDLRGIEDC